MARPSHALEYLEWRSGQPPVDPRHVIFVRVGRYIDAGRYVDHGWIEIVGPNGKWNKRFWPDAWAPAPADVFV